MTAAISYRYAQALCQLASSRDQLRKEIGVLESFSLLLQSFPKLRAFFQAPHISRHQKQEFVKSCFQQTLPPILFRLLTTLLAKDRLHILPDIARSYKKLGMKLLELNEAEVISAIPLDLVLQEKVRTKLEAMTSHQIVIKNEVDSSIIGGMIIIIGTQMIDGSIRTQLQQLKQKLYEVSHATET